MSNCHLNTWALERQTRIWSPFSPSASLLTNFLAQKYNGSSKTSEICITAGTALIGSASSTTTTSNSTTTTVLVRKSKWPKQLQPCGRHSILSWSTQLTSTSAKSGTTCFTVSKCLLSQRTSLTCATPTLFPPLSLVLTEISIWSSLSSTTFQRRTWCLSLCIAYRLVMSALWTPKRCEQHYKSLWSSNLSSTKRLATKLLKSS